MEAVRAMYREGSIGPAMPYLDDEIVLDWSKSIGPYRGVYRGYDGAQGFFRTVIESFGQTHWEPHEPLRIRNRVAIGSRFTIRGSASGVEATALGGQVWTFAGGKVTRIKMHQSRGEAVRDMRAETLDEAHLYFVTDLRGGTERARPLVEAALAGGADVIQLRDRELDGDALAEGAALFREASSASGALFFVNDRPELAAESAADGVHVGQDDLGVSEARALAGDGALVGLSTHSPAQLDAAGSAAGDARADYTSVGPVWETPTKPGRPASGLGYVRYAAANAKLPWFAIGGIDADNVDEVVDAGAGRIVAVRAIRDAADPRAAAELLRRAAAGATTSSA